MTPPRRPAITIEPERRGDGAGEGAGAGLEAAGSRGVAGGGVVEDAGLPASRPKAEVEPAAEGDFGASGRAGPAEDGADDAEEAGAEAALAADDVPDGGTDAVLRGCAAVSVAAGFCASEAGFADPGAAGWLADVAAPAALSTFLSPVLPASGDAASTRFTSSRPSSMVSGSPDGFEWRILGDLTIGGSGTAGGGGGDCARRD
jgi:hypothetical protein